MPSCRNWICKGWVRNQLGHHCAIITRCVKCCWDISILRFLLARFTAGGRQWTAATKTLFCFIPLNICIAHNIPLCMPSSNARENLFREPVSLSFSWSLCGFQSYLCLISPNILVFHHWKQVERSLGTSDYSFLPLFILVSSSLNLTSITEITVRWESHSS